MTRKIVAGVAAGLLLTSITLFAAQKAQDKKPAAKQKQQAKEIEKKPGGKDLLDQLVAAYKANDREKMGQIINKMEARRDKARKLAMLNKWHNGAHRKMAAQAGPRWGRGGAAAGPCPRQQFGNRGLGGGAADWRGGWAAGGPGFNRGRAMGWGGGQWEGQPWRRNVSPGWGAMAERPGPTPGFGQGPGRFSPQNWNRPLEGRRQTNPPPVDWGW
jgi:hypothetical protein